MKEKQYSLEIGTERSCICKYKSTNFNCLNFEKGECKALSNCMFLDKDLNKRQCPFYKVGRNYKYAVWDNVNECVVSFEKTLDEARASVKIASGEYYGTGLDDKRYIIKDWKGELWKLRKY